MTYGSKIRNSLQSEGAAARAAGLSLAACPRFVHPDMVVDWQIGWRREDGWRSGVLDADGMVLPEERAVKTRENP